MVKKKINALYIILYIYIFDLEYWRYAKHSHSEAITISYR